MTTLRRRTFAIRTSALAFAVFALATGPQIGAHSRISLQGVSDPPQRNTHGPAMSADEMNDRSQKLMANQHNDDEALDLYDRVEEQTERTGGANPRTLDDKTYRVVPTGSGNQKILVRDAGRPTDSAEYRRQLQILEGVLQIMANPDDSRAKAAYAKYDKRKHDRAEFVEATKDAFLPKWMGTSACGGRPCDVFELDPDPKFRPHSMFEDALVHVTATLWVDHETNQMARGEARIISDAAFGGGILGKLYRGSVVSIEQGQIAPGIWLPTRYQYDYAGRKFLFSFQEHEIIEVSHYRRVGPPTEALAIVQKELASGKAFDQNP